MADVVTEVAPERRTGGGATPHGPRRGLQPATRNDAQFKTRAWSLSGVFHVMFSDCSGSQVTEAVESGSAGRGGCCTPLPRAGAPQHLRGCGGRLRTPVAGGKRAEGRGRAHDAPPAPLRGLIGVVQTSPSLLTATQKRAS